ncbi:MAG: hydrogenase formation protein HypD [Candidatus Thermoplasmatota archaeon]
MLSNTLQLGKQKDIISKASHKLKHIFTMQKKKIKFMHVCGTHEQTIAKYGLRKLLPEGLEVIPGPGCPVCITPSRDIDIAIELAKTGKTLAVFGDMFRVAGSEESLADAKAKGCEVIIVYSVSDAVKYAKKHKEKEVVFFSIGLETTAPTVAFELLNRPPKNFSIIPSNRLTPPVMELLLGMGDFGIDGWICPGHVSTIIGLEPWRIFPQVYGMPTVIAGFEPIDVMISIIMLLKQLNDKPKLDNEYARVVREGGNKKAKELIRKVFEIKTDEWRGIGNVPQSALKLRKEFKKYDAIDKYGIETKTSKDFGPGCKCHLVIIGKIKPSDCSLYNKFCKPESPRGPCMVSSEGSCNIAYRYRYE